MPPELVEMNGRSEVVIFSSITKVAALGLVALNRALNAPSRDTKESYKNNTIGEKCLKVMRWHR